MTSKYILESTLERRASWIANFQAMSGDFEVDAQKLETALASEGEKAGVQTILDHLRTCGAIPEQFGHDSSEEKLYSKYTDALLAAAFTFVGIKSLVLQERGDSADVEGVVEDYDFVADAKAFRLSRTAKNQKDFKVSAMHDWKRGKAFAIVVCPSYQLPTSSSQIYSQAIDKDVCILTYSHVCGLVRLADKEGEKAAQHALGNILRCVKKLTKSKEASLYWKAVNAVMLGSHPSMVSIWKDEQEASEEAICAARKEALDVLEAESERINKMSREEAIAELLSKGKVQARAGIIRKVADSGVLYRR